MYDLTNEPDPRVLAFLGRIESPLLVLAATVAAAVALLWIVPPLATWAPDGWSWMTLPTAFGILMVATSLALSGPAASQEHGRIALVGALTLLVIAATVLALDVAPLLTRNERPSWLPLLPSTQTALAFTLFGASCLMSCHARKQESRVADLVVIALFGLLLFMLAGHLFNLTALVATADGRLMSPHTLFCFFLLAFVLAGRLAAGSGPLSALAGRGTGSQITRHLLPFVTTAPFALFALIAYLDDSGLLPEARSRAVIAPALALAAIAVIAGMGLRTNRLEADLRRQSTTDKLTNVLNRRGLDAVSGYALRNAARERASLIVLFFDLDGLKQVNDTQGHDAGSLLIRRFADILAATFRKNDIIARVGGDEFIVLASGDLASVADILARLERTVAACEAPGTVRCDIAYSVGYAAVPPGATDLDATVAQADDMMYRHKHARKTGRTPRAAPHRPAAEFSRPDAYVI